MKEMLKQLNQRPIAYYPIYRDIAGSTTAGILLSQLMYWFSKQDKIFKTDSEIMNETSLSENELRTAKKLIKKLDFITVKLEGLPAKTYYEIDWKTYQTSLVKSTELDKLNSQDSVSEINETFNDKSFDTETTTETTYRDIEKDKKEIPIILELWNATAEEFALNKISKITSKRKTKLVTRLNENNNFLEDFKTAIENIRLSNFLKGKNNRNWKIDFDWLIANDTNFIKVLEGKYTDVTAPAQQMDLSKFGHNKTEEFIEASVIESLPATGVEDRLFGGNK
ncbi:MAG: hypothetical protein PF437_11145 [Sulfurimonas sp.]|jgi:hypothetical protein|nr:hypothetical protein [Sulfurimonas sp.]